MDDKWNEPIPLTAPDGRVFAYACPQCEHVKSIIEGGDFEGRVEFSESDARRCCCCQNCGLNIGRNWESLCPICKEIRVAEVAEYNKQQEPIVAAQEARREAALSKAKNREAALLLQQAMSDISEDYYCAGWLLGLETILWPMLSGGDRRFGMAEVGEDEVAQLKYLSDLCGGWWRYDDEDGETFVTAEEWTAQVTTA